MSSKHAASLAFSGWGPVVAVKAFLARVFVRRMLEQLLVAFVVAGYAAFEASGGSFSRAALGGVAAAGLRAVYGLLVKSIGPGDTPSVL